MRLYKTNTMRFFYPRLVFGRGGEGSERGKKALKHIKPLHYVLDCVCTFAVIFCDCVFDSTAIRLFFFHLLFLSFGSICLASVWNEEWDKNQNRRHSLFVKAGLFTHVIPFSWTTDYICFFFKLQSLFYCILSFFFSQIHIPFYLLRNWWAIKSQSLLLFRYHIQHFNVLCEIFVELQEKWIVEIINNDCLIENSFEIWNFHEDFILKSKRRTCLALFPFLWVAC